MTDERKNGGPAFPLWQPDMNIGDDAGPGMTLRDWFAGQALAGLATLNPDCGAKGLALDAYSIADAMLNVRDKDIDDDY